MPQVLQAFDNEILYLPKLLFPDIYMSGMVKRSEAGDGVPETIRVVITLVSRKLEGMISTDSSEVNFITKSSTFT